MRLRLLILLALSASISVGAQDFTVTAPYTSPNRTTCGQSNNCGLETSEDHQYQVSIPTTGTWVFSLCGSSYDTRLYLGNANCLGNLGYNDDACGLQSEITSTLTAGTYFVTVEGWSGACGNYVLSINGSAPPAPEDLCSGAIPIDCGDVVSGNTSSYTTDAVPFCGTGDGGNGLWYSFTGNGQPISASLCGSAFDTKIRVFSGSCTGLVCVTGNDDFCGTQSEVTWTSIVGTTYYILVFGFGTASGAYTLSLNCLPPPGPSCIQSDPTPYAPFAYAGTPVTLIDDNHSGVVNIGFNFCFMGNTYSQCVISSNNYITFDLTQAGQFSSFSTVPVPSTAPDEIRNSILGPWQDINPASGGSIYYQTLGTAPDRVFVVSYLDIPMYSCTSQLYTSQIILMEGSNCIQTLIQRKPVCATWNDGNAVYAVQNSTASGVEVVPGRNNTQWSITDEGRIWAPSCGTCQTTGSNVCLADVLPIELLDFKVRSDNGSHFVEWLTASEINNDYFTLEHSIDGENFNDLTHIPGAGNSSALLEYSYANHHIVQGNNYYRLRQTDFDGTTSHSQIIVINESSIENFSLSPNPAQSSLLISLKDFKGQNTEMRIINSLGQLIYSLSVSDPQLELDVSEFPEGFYFLEIRTEKKASVKRFLKN